MIDEKALLAFLDERAKDRDVNKTSGLVIASIYAGLADRIRNGDFDAREIHPR